MDSTAPPLPRLILTIDDAGDENLSKGDLRMRSTYGFSRTLEMPYAKAVETVTQILEQEGFRRLTQVDLGPTLRDDSSADSRPHLVMGFCNPDIARKMLSGRPELGLLALATVAICDIGDGASTLCIDDPYQTLGAASMPELQPLTKELNRKLWRAYVETIIAAASSNAL